MREDRTDAIDTKYPKSSRQNPCRRANGGTWRDRRLRVLSYRWSKGMGSNETNVQIVLCGSASEMQYQIDRVLMQTGRFVSDRKSDRYTAVDRNQSNSQDRRPKWEQQDNESKRIRRRRMRGRR